MPEIGEPKAGGGTCLREILGFFRKSWGGPREAPMCIVFGLVDLRI